MDEFTKLLRRYEHEYGVTTFDAQGYGVRDTVIHAVGQDVDEIFANALRRAVEIAAETCPDGSFKFEKLIDYDGGHAVWKHIGTFNVPGFAVAT